jgi:hypothetical protein
MTWLDAKDLPHTWSPLCRLVNFWDGKTNDEDTKNAVYRVVALAKGDMIPARLDRILAHDETGTLYIGCTQTSIFGRIGQFHRACQGRHGHGGGDLYFGMKTLARKYPLEQLAVTWLSDKTPIDTERALIAAYAIEFGEGPPLNRLRGAA